MPEPLLDPGRERDLRFCMTVLRPEVERLLRVMQASHAPWQLYRWYRACREVERIQARWQRILRGEEHAPC